MTAQICETEDLVVLGAAGLFYNLDKLFGTLGDNVGFACTDRIDVDQIGPDTERRRACFYEIRSCLKRNASGGDHLDLGKRTFEVLQITRTANRPGGKYLYEIGAG